MKTIEQLEAQRQENILKIRGDANARHWANILAKRALPGWKKPKPPKDLKPLASSSASRRK